MKNEDKIINRLFEKAQEVVLSSEEKAKVRGEIKTFMQANPPIHNPIKSPFFKDVKWHGVMGRQFAPALVVAFVVLGGGISAAAQGSLPGDVLYPIKIHVNEEAKALLSVGTESEVRTKIDVANERLVEIEKLTSANKISPEVLAIAEAGFMVKAEEIKKQVKELKEKGETLVAHNLSSDFEVSLKNHHGLLVALSGKEESGASDALTMAITARVENEKNLLSDLTEAVRGELQSTTMTREKVENVIATTTSQSRVKESAIGAERSARNKIEEVEKYINKNSGVDAELKAEALARLEKSKIVFKEGELKLGEGSYSEAFKIFKDSSRQAQEAKLILNVRDRARGVISEFINIRKSEDIRNASTTVEIKIEAVDEKEEVLEVDNQTDIEIVIPEVKVEI